MVIVARVIHDVLCLGSCCLGVYFLQWMWDNGGMNFGFYNLILGWGA